MDKIKEEEWDNFLEYFMKGHEIVVPTEGDKRILLLVTLPSLGELPGTQTLRPSPPPPTRKGPNNRGETRG